MEQHRKLEWTVSFKPNQYFLTMRRLHSQHVLLSSVIVATVLLADCFAVVRSWFLSEAHSKRPPTNLGRFQIEEITKIMAKMEH